PRDHVALTDDRNPLQLVRRGDMRCKLRDPSVCGFEALLGIEKGQDRPHPACDDGQNGRQHELWALDAVKINNNRRNNHNEYNTGPYNYICDVVDWILRGCRSAVVLSHESSSVRSNTVSK